MLRSMTTSLLDKTDKIGLIFLGTMYNLMMFLCDIYLCAPGPSLRKCDIFPLARLLSDVDQYIYMLVLTHY
jgi:hypothetical protein